MCRPVHSLVVGRWYAMNVVMIIAVVIAVVLASPPTPDAVEVVESLVGGVAGEGAAHGPAGDGRGGPREQGLLDHVSLSCIIESIRSFEGKYFNVELLCSPDVAQLNLNSSAVSAATVQSAAGSTVFWKQ